MNERILVTGMGLVTPLGHTVDQSFKGLVAGKNAIQTIPEFVEAGFPVTIGAKIANLGELLSQYPLASKYHSRKIAYLQKSADEAMASAGIRCFSQIKTGLFLGMETSRIPFAKSFEIFKKAANQEHKIDMKKFGEHCQTLLSKEEISAKFPIFPPSLLAAQLGIHGFIMGTSNACASSNYAIGDALRKLREGRIDVAVVGSADEMIDEYMVTGFSLLHALSVEQNPDIACRPFDVRRSGFILGEAGATLILERESHAKRRGAPVVCELAGFGSSSDARKITACDPRGDGLSRAMQAALQSGGMTTSDVNYINAHGTSTMLNDISESRALRSLFGDAADQLFVNSTKSMIGHSVAAAGAVEAVVTAQSILEGVIHPTRNLEQSDPACDLNYCGEGAVTTSIHGAISNSCGFSGGNSCLLFRKFEEYQ